MKRGQFSSVTYSSESKSKLEQDMNISTPRNLQQLINIHLRISETKAKKSL